MFDGTIALCQNKIVYFNPFIFSLSSVSEFLSQHLSVFCLPLSLSLSLSLSLCVLVLDVEDLGVAGGGGGDESSVKELEDFVADVGELRLDPGQKALPKWVAIRVESGLRSGLRCQSGLRSGSSRLRSGFYVCVCVCVFFFL